MTDSDAVPCRWGIWDVLRNKIAEVKFSLLLKLKNCGCGELFRNRTKPKDCCWCIRHVEFHVGEAVTLCQDHLAMFRKKDRALDASGLDIRVSLSRQIGGILGGHCSRHRDQGQECFAGAHMPQSIAILTLERSSVMSSREGFTHSCRQQPFRSITGLIVDSGRVPVGSPRTRCPGLGGCDAGSWYS